MSSDTDLHDARRRGDKTYIRLLTRAPVDEEQLVSTDAIELRAGRVVTIWKLPFGRHSPLQNPARL